MKIQVKNAEEIDKVWKSDADVAKDIKKHSGMIYEAELLKSGIYAGGYIVEDIGIFLEDEVEIVRDENKETS